MPSANAELYFLQSLPANLAVEVRAVVRKTLVNESSEGVYIYRIRPTRERKTRKQCLATTPNGDTHAFVVGGLTGNPKTRTRSVRHFEAEIDSERLI
ncbi:hypothetical protein L596_013636 [Steinernema carpocapsae]|uniref:Uncharacterized protein n=1 Tax=Steinernema carpocapsae TaxID=34508 RepID=A0A4U5P1M0_STECR|nr:hypothetical protein L596_013636 [Steinernema carpocapsae]